MRGPRAPTHAVESAGRRPRDYVVFVWRRTRAIRCRRDGPRGTSRGPETGMATPYKNDTRDSCALRRLNGRASTGPAIRRP